MNMFPKKNLIADATKIDTYARSVQHLLLVLMVHKGSIVYRQVLGCKAYTYESNCEQQVLCQLKTLVESVHYAENLHKLYRILLIADCNLWLEKIIRSYLCAH
jgi:hypothetical protein